MAASALTLSRVAEIVEARGRAAQRWPGNMKAETVDEIANGCAHAGRIVRTVAQYSDGLRALIEVLRDMADVADLPPDTLAALRRHPSVQAVMASFPESTLTGSRPIPAIGITHPGADTETSGDDA